MSLAELLHKESKEDRGWLLGMGVLTGLSNAVIIAIITAASENAEAEPLDFRLLLLFMIGIVLFIISQRYIFRQTSLVFEHIVDRFRKRLTEKIKRSDLRNMERIGKANIYDKMSQRCSEISQMGAGISAALQSAIMTVFIIGYIAFISLPAFAMTIVIVSVGVFIYLKKQQAAIDLINISNRREVDLFDSITDLLEGFQEIKINFRKRQEVGGDVRKISTDVRDLKMETFNINSDNYIFAQVFFYVLVGAVVFVLPTFVDSYHTDITGVATAILFIIGPLSTVVSGIPAYTRADIAAREIVELENMLDRQNGRKSYPDAAASAPMPDEETAPDAEAVARLAEFDTISLEGVTFHYTDREGKSGFGVGPFSFDIRNNEVLFIVGGNGSGKSTLLKLLVGLYHPEQGQIKIDDRFRMNRDNAQIYRELFSVVFYDFHLFKKLYAIRNLDEERIHDLLVMMQLEEKTSFEEDRFTNLELSSGQRKRLALLTALLEDRPVYVFDEWAADQDPEFRAYFYHTILPDLKAAGKTVVAVTHDDMYFDTADRIIRLDYGSSSWIKN